MRDRARAAKWSEAQVARLQSYYFGLVQLMHLRGNDTCLHNGLVKSYTGIGESQQSKYRRFLREIGLIEVRTQKQNGGRKLHWYELLRVPKQGYRPGAAKRERKTSCPEQDKPPDHIWDDDTAREL
ncbi:hypothetical protein ACFLR0_00780 [Candidatus Bipolaricaulota bacterium]